MMKSVVNALRMLEAIGENQPVGVSELARTLAMPKSTVQRGLSTLHSQHWVFQPGSDPTRWALSPKVLALASKVSNQYGLREVAMPILQKLHTIANETTILAVFDAAILEPVPLVSLDSNRAIRYMPVVGKTLPLHTTAIGKAILAALPPDTRADVLARLQRRPSNDATTGDLDPDEIDRVRLDGYAVSVGEYAEDVSSVAAAILIPDLSTAVGTRSVVGAVSISGPTQRLPPSTLEAIADNVVRAAHEIGSMLGASSTPGASD